jgi:hypothetical protein
LRTSSRFPPARKTIDLEGRIVKDGVRKALRDHQLALAELVHAIKQFRKIAESKPLNLQDADYAHAVHELNKAIDRADGLLLRWSVQFLILAAFVMATTPAFAVELFRYRGAAKDGGTLEYIFEAGEQNSPNAVTKEKAAEIAADFMTAFYHVQVGALETQEFRTSPVPFWLVCFFDTVKGALRQMFFVVLLPDGTVVEPSMAKWM